MTATPQKSGLQESRSLQALHRTPRNRTLCLFRGSLKLTKSPPLGTLSLDENRLINLRFLADHENLHELSLVGNDLP
ncbi:MAG: hypothetical protein M2R45_01829 [Verrucomicrobia subdivision 3 bacterium]|nr:hypothetical protein [Limisphaerales bacterium]MCS1415629.1 hypothetical protein [Limisphaerales bacterium]